MTKLTSLDVLKLAQLAKLKLSEEEQALYAEGITAILNFVEQLKEVDISGLEPTNQVTGLSNVWREDEIIDYGYSADDLLKNVPKLEQRFIKVGRMIE